MRIAGLGCIKEGDAVDSATSTTFNQYQPKVNNISFGQPLKTGTGAEPEMSISTAVCQLQSLVSKAELLAKNIRGIKPCQTREQYEELDALKTRLQEVTAEVTGAVEILEHDTAERVRAEGKKFLDQVETARTYMFQNHRLKSISAFRKSVSLIFEGPKDSAIDTGSVKYRNKQTRQRCELIRGLNCDGVISWAAGLAPSVWTGGNMHNHIFNHVIEGIEPEARCSWPTKVQDVLRIFGNEEPLSRCEEYQKFLSG